MAPENDANIVGRIKVEGEGVSQHENMHKHQIQFATAGPKSGAGGLGLSHPPPAHKKRGN